MSVAAVSKSSVRFRLSISGPLVEFRGCKRRVKVVYISISILRLYDPVPFFFLASSSPFHLQRLRPFGRAVNLPESERPARQHSRRRFVRCVCPSSRWSVRFPPSSLLPQCARPSFARARWRAPSSSASPPRPLRRDPPGRRSRRHSNRSDTDTDTHTDTRVDRGRWVEPAVRWWPGGVFSRSEGGATWAPLSPPRLPHLLLESTAPATQRRPDAERHRAGERAALRGHRRQRHVGTM